MKLFAMFSRKDQHTDPQKAAVKRISGEMLKKYEKTFADLAKYDRGETIRPVSQ